MGSGCALQSSPVPLSLLALSRSWALGPLALLGARSAQCGARVARRALGLPRAMCGIPGHNVLCPDRISCAVSFSNCASLTVLLK